MIAARVSIVIAAHNAGKTIFSALSACVGQKGLETDVIVVDDGSNDNSKEVVLSFPRVRYIYQDRHGPAAARNRGWKESGTEIVLFTDADCIPEDDWAFKLLQRFSSEKIGAVGGSYGIINKDNLLAACIHEEIILRHSRMPFEARALGSFNLAVRRKVLEEVGGFSEGYKTASAEDNDLSYKILKKGYKLIFDTDIKVSHLHPERLLRYLTRQFWHGFWRVKLYARHPDMARGDDYSNLLDYFQPLLAIAILCFFPLLIFFPLWSTVVFCLLIEFLLQLPIAIPVLLRTKRIKYLALIPLMFIRAFFRGGGLIAGVLRR